MGYACPVCDVPQADGEHLANHLAFTAMLHAEDHATWLDETVGGWEEMTVAELSTAVVEHAEETEYTEVFEDTAGDNPGPGRTPAENEHPHGHDHDHGHARDQDLDFATARNRAASRGPTDTEIRRIIEQAREMTEDMQAETDDEATDGDQDREG
ncbi:MAG: DUF5810 domain-containing protein [Halobacteriales archaeon]